MSFASERSEVHKGKDLRAFCLHGKSAALPIQPLGIRLSFEPYGRYKPVDVVPLYALADHLRGQAFLQQP
jgi:hypothetical protein